MSLLLGCLVCSMGGISTPLTVTTFNLRYALAKDGENAWPKRRELVVETIRRMAPDVLGTQECLHCQATYLAQALPDYAKLGLGREVGGKGEMAALFYRKDVLALEASGHFWLSETPEVRGSRSWNTCCTRMVTWARFRHLKTGGTFQMFNTHFDHISEEARVNSAKLLLERIQALPKDLPVIITGDFNATAETCVPWQILTKAGFQDAWLAATDRVGPDITYGDFKAPPVDAKQQRIDWILLRHAAAVQRCETVTYNKDGRYPTDHYPVTASITLDAK